MASTWSGTAKIKGSSESVRMALLTVSLSGVQLVWGIEMAYCAPYLLSLGLTKSLMSLVWNVGPISGMICQPIVGAMADRSTSKWGRRRPVIIIGSVLVSVALFVLGWTKEIVGLFIADGDLAKTATIVLAVLAIYMVDFAVNAVQACCRALIVDTLPIPQQQHGSAWASRMIAVGNIAGYFAGMIDLVGIFGTTFGSNQFKNLMVVSAVSLMACVGITCYSVSERVLVTRKDQNNGVWHIFATIWGTVFNLPNNIWAICIILFWSWIGWFPFQVYTTAFVGEVLKRYDTGRQTDLESSADKVGDITRVGSMALVLFSCVSLVASVCLPWLIESPDGDELPAKTPRSGGLFANFLEALEPYKPDLTTTWIWGHISFGVLMMFTLVASTVSFATFLVAFSGVAWALMTWAPFSLVGEMIIRLGGQPPAGHRRHRSSSGIYSQIPRDEQDQDMVEMNVSRVSMSTSVPPFSAEDIEAAANSGNSNELSGIYLGILNIFACLPQMVGSFLSFVVFSILEPGKSPEFSGDDDVEEIHGGVNAIAVCLAIGGLCTMVAAHYTLKFKRLYQ